LIEDTACFSPVLVPFKVDSLTAIHL